jgi:hypothetical protein
MIIRLIFPNIDAQTHLLFTMPILRRRTKKPLIYVLIALYGLTKKMMVKVKPLEKLQYNPINDVFTPEQKEEKKQFILKHHGKDAYIYVGKLEQIVPTRLMNDHCRMVDIGWIQRIELRKKPKK